MNLQSLFFVLSTTCFFRSSQIIAAPRVQIQSGETILATWGAIAGTLQVQADKTTFDAKTQQMRLQGNVVLTAKDARGRLSTLRANQAVLSTPDAEFQITQKGWDAEMGWFDALQNQGDHAGFIESVLRSQVQKHAGFSSYRLCYSGVGAGAGTSGSVLYNRRAQTLKIYEIFNYPSAGILNITDTTYHGVSDAILFKALDYKDENGKFLPNGPNFANLKKYGAKVTDNSRRFRFRATQ